MLKALGKKIILKAVEEAKKGSLLLPGAKPSKYMAEAVGDEVKNVKKGDVVYLDKHHGAALEHENEKFLIVEENSILAAID